MGSVAVRFCGLWSMPLMSDASRRYLPPPVRGLPVVLSSDVLPMIREWERTCCAVLSAYILPGIARYMLDLERFLRDHSFGHPLQIMQLNGGCSTVANVLRRPIYALAWDQQRGQQPGLIACQRLRAATLLRSIWAERASTFALSMAANPRLRKSCE